MKRYTHYWMRYRTECGLISLLLAAMWGIRYLASLYTGIEVDEPIYRFAAAYAAQYGFPAVRAAVGQPTIPFLYHPPFSLLILGEWFRIWHSTSYFTGRLFSVCISTLMLALLYLFVRRKIGLTEAVLALLFTGSDGWIIFSNQGIYIENSQLILIILAVWAYWWAAEAESTCWKQVTGRYLFAGMVVGCVLIYKQIGGFIILSILANWLFRRRHHLGHLLLFIVAGSILIGYFLVMHLSFGTLFDNATFVQIERTLWNRSSSGLTYSPWLALQAIGDHYFIFLSTIVVLVSGSTIAIIRSVQHLFKKRQGNTIVLSWALGGVIFALSISLKSPHYMILWLVPLYLLIIQEGCRWMRRRLAILQRITWLALIASLLIFINLWSYQARFLHVPGNTLTAADAYINANISATATVITEDYIGVDIRPQYVNINFVQTPQAVFQSRADYIALYWSTTEPIPASLGNIASYCTPMAILSGFKDHIEVCHVDRHVLSKLYAPATIPLDVPESIRRTP